MPRSDLSCWLATVGLGRQFGGVAGVARACAHAFDRSPGWSLQRTISLLDDSDADAELSRGANRFLVGCGGSRKRFALAMLGQMFDRPRVIVYDHVDVAQCQTILPNPLRVPHALWVHGIEVWKQLPRRKLAAMAQSELLIFNSEFTRRRFESFHSLNVDQIVVPLTYEMPEYDIGQRSSRQPWILTVGRMEPDRPKGHAETLAVLPELIRRVPDLKWHVVGAGKHLNSFRKQVAAAGCEKHVVFHGFLANECLLELYRQARVFCMPSHGEGFGIVYLEAMSQGCVPIGSTKDAAKEVIGDAGYCVGLSDPLSLQHRLENLLTIDEQAYALASRRAVSRCELFSPDRFAVQFNAALERFC